MIAKAYFPSSESKSETSSAIKLIKDHTTAKCNMTKSWDTSRKAKRKAQRYIWEVTLSRTAKMDISSR